MNFSRYVKTMNIAIPMMISGTTNENIMRTFAPAAGRPCHRSMPMANSTPNGTAISIVRNDRRRLWISAECRSGFTKSDPSGWTAGWPNHHCSEKPCHTTFERPELKDNAIAINTGTSDHARYSHVTVARRWGFLQGSFHHLVNGLPRSASGAGSRAADGAVTVWLIVPPAP